MPVHSQWLATSPARLAAMAPHRTAQINSFGMQHESTFEAPAGVHNGGSWVQCWQRVITVRNLRWRTSERRITGSALGGVRITGMPAAGPVSAGQRPQGSSSSPGRRCPGTASAMRHLGLPDDTLIPDTSIGPLPAIWLPHQSRMRCLASCMANSAASCSTKHRSADVYRTEPGGYNERVYGYLKCHKACFAGSA
jgi:hypothetical protein